MSSPKTKRNLSGIIPFGLIWLFFSLLYTQMEKGLLADLTYYPATGNAYHFGTNLWITSLSSLITGLFIGTLEMLYVKARFIQRTFTEKIIYKTTLYLAIIIIFLLGLSTVANAHALQISLFHPQVWKKVSLFFFTYAFLSVGLYMAVIIVISQFYLEVSDNLGHGVLMNFLSGKYHTPKEEERIFMFLDMTSSTSIAEKLGHVRYFNLLREYYADLSDPIVSHSGEIYQYVGDEIVVSWKLKNGIRDHNCIRCFDAMKRKLQQQSKKYTEKYGLAPTFKAGFHCGKVTTGEIGVIKKDIIFTGDVLNTTARLQGLCHTYGTDLLISDVLIRKLNLSSDYHIQSLGENELRGRDEKIELFTIDGL